MTIAIDWEVKQQFKQTNKQNQYAEAIITHVSYIDSHKLAKSGYFVSSSIRRDEEFFFYSIEFLVIKSEFLVNKSEFLVNKREFLVMKSECRV